MKKILFILSTVALLTLTACHDDASLYGDGANTAGGNELRVVVPTSRANADGSLTDDEKKAIFFTTEEECQINTLRIIVFGENGTMIFNEAVANIPTAKDLNNHNGGNDNTYAQQSIETENKVKPGKYKVYVVANYNDHDATKGTYTEKKELAEVTKIQDLEKLLLEYSATAMPTAGNLPMVYVPKDENGKDKLVTVTAQEGGTVYADLQFTCAKVRYNLIFDKESTDSKAKETFGDNRLDITSVDGKQLSAVAPLIWDGNFTRDYTSDLYKDKTPFTATLANNQYYSTWTYNENNANVTNALMVDGASSQLTDVTKTDKWLYQGTCYVPERFVTSDADQSYLQFNGQIYGSNGTATTTTNHYTMPLGHDDSKSDSHIYLPRSTFYELVGNIETIGSAKLKTAVKFAAWQNVAIAADFSHTTLWVSAADKETIGTITPLQSQSIKFTTNATSIKVASSTLDNEKKKPILYESTINDNSGTIELKINPALTIDDFKDKEKGTATISITANNLTKFIEVAYDVTPVFVVKPTEHTIYWTDETDDDSKATLIKTVRYYTNLGGMKITKVDGKVISSTTSPITSTVVNSSITISPAVSTDAEGVITITATSDPKTSTVHTFTVEPNNSSYTTYSDIQPYTVTVTVKPPVGDYRIYFRAINDRQKYNGWGYDNNAKEYERNNVEEFVGILTEYTSTGDNNNNWSDGWENTWNDKGITTTASSADGSCHHCYAYMQMGETSLVNGDMKNDVVWKKVTSGTAEAWPGVNMTADYSNPGWYYRKITYNDVWVRQNTESKNPDNYPKPKIVQPAYVRMIFINNQNGSNGWTLHRVSHHLEAGVPLFNYEDREGWVLYDPTTEDLYTIYDDKPTVEDVTYTVYTLGEMTGWYHIYGRCQQALTNYSQFTIYDNSQHSWKKETSDVTGYSKATITLKAPRGYHEKGIMVKFGNNTTGTMLFGGASYEKYGDTGYYDGTSWHPGKPSSGK